MNAVTFDKLTYVSKLERSGFSREQAEAQAEALDTALRESVATKNDVTDLKYDINLLRTEISGEMQLVKWMCGLMLAGVVSLIVKSFFV